MEIKELMAALKNFYQIVRVVDVSTNKEYMVDENGEVNEKENYCFDAWGKASRCENCISAQAYRTKGRLDKFEFIGKEIYYVVAKYVTFQGEGYVLELANRVDSASFTGAIDRNLFAEQIREFDKMVNIDALTGAYNRRYYEEQLQSLDRISAIAMFDIDHFKSINDGYGHQFGDVILKNVAGAIMDCVRHSDVLIRYGGDEFIIVFAGIPAEVFELRLNQIRQKVEGLTFEQYPEARVTISMGGLVTRSCSEEDVRQADKLLYEAKKTRNCVVV